MRFKVFIENEAGSSRKNHHNERTLVFERSESVACPYPFPYGFIIDTVNADGDCLDCFVITARSLRTGEIIECDAIGLMEQAEDVVTDNNVLANLPDEPLAVTVAVRAVLTEFVQHVFSHIPGRTIAVGRFLGVREAEVEIDQCRTPIDVREESLTALLVEHAKIPIAFIVASVLDSSPRDDGTFDLAERAIPSYVKDYDAVEPPAQWLHRFDVTTWGLLSAYHDGERVGGAVIACDPRGITLLEGRVDVALLWDLRVRPDARRQGVGRALFHAAERWARARHCTEMKIETQNVNVAACRFYEQHGCALRRVTRGAYAAFPDEIQLLWYKTL